MTDPKPGAAVILMRCGDCDCHEQFGQPTVAASAETAGTGRYESWELGVALSGTATHPVPGEAPRAADVALGALEQLQDLPGGDPALLEHRLPDRG